MSDPFDGDRLLADTSAWTNVHKAPSDVQEKWKEALREGRIVCCPVVQFELSQGAPNYQALELLGERLSAIDHIPVQRSTVKAALQALDELAAMSPGHHRGVKLADVLIAAAASDDRYLPVLHYDRHFDRLQKVLSFESRAIMPYGT